MPNPHQTREQREAAEKLNQIYAKGRASYEQEMRNRPKMTLAEMQAKIDGNGKIRYRTEEEQKEAEQRAILEAEAKQRAILAADNARIKLHELKSDPEKKKFIRSALSSLAGKTAMAADLDFPRIDKDGNIAVTISADFNTDLRVERKISYEALETRIKSLQIEAQEAEEADRKKQEDFWKS